MGIIAGTATALSTTLGIIGGALGATAGAVGSAATAVGAGLGATAFTVGGQAVTYGALAGTAATVAGTATSVSTSVYSGYQQQQQARAQGKAQEAMASYNSQVASNAETAANQGAKAEINAAEERTDRQKAQNKRLMSRQQALMGVSGTMGSGTNILLEEDQLAEMKLQELDIMHQGELSARQHRLQAMGHASEAMGSQFQGQQARSGAKSRGRSAVAGGWWGAAGAAGKGLSGGLSSYMKSSSTIPGATRSSSYHDQFNTG